MSKKRKDEELVGVFLELLISRFQFKFKKRSPNWGTRNLHKECAHPNGWRDKHTHEYVAEPPTQVTHHASSKHTYFPLHSLAQGREALIVLMWLVISFLYCSCMSLVTFLCSRVFFTLSILVSGVSTWLGLVEFVNKTIVVSSWFPWSNPRSCLWSNIAVDLSLFKKYLKWSSIILKEC